MQLNPQEIFTIARGLEDHTDNTVFYVRATVRNALTDALLDTVTLTNQGDNHRYSASYQVPADVSGAGFYIVVTTSVYSDSGYTTKTPLYGDRYDTYLVMQRLNPGLGMGGGGDSVDYKKIGKMIDEAISKIAFPAFPEQKESQQTDLAPVFSRLDEIKECVEKMEMPEQKELDLAPIVKKIDEIVLRAENFNIPDSALRPLSDLQDSLAASVEEHQERLAETLLKAESMIEKLREFFGKDVDGIKEGIDGLKEQFDAIPYLVLDRKQEKKA